MHVKVEQWSGFSTCFVDDEVVEGVVLGTRGQSVDRIDLTITYLGDDEVLLVHENGQCIRGM